ncbi:hypothetical protein K144316041_p20260 (plasmid) [Clostridium tetani]|uniref:hypothetical protein n=1 Tax=Clostridium tetani TaxID=1513 RepID=UPI002953D73E|nr:hypothetical protein [Clostridium tetani]BDR74187.1 hypothetical protein K144316041_p20260 [Clostridium tetani]
MVNEVTTYDDIWTEFLVINKTESINLPQTENQIYDIIHSAIRHFNNKMHEDGNLKFNDEKEVLNRKLTDSEQIIIAHILKYYFLQNNLTYYTSLFKPFTKEIGLIHYKADVKSIEDAINREEKKINELIFNVSEDYL